MNREIIPHYSSIIIETYLDVSKAYKDLGKVKQPIPQPEKYKEDYWQRLGRQKRTAEAITKFTIFKTTAEVGKTE